MGPTAWDPHPASLHRGLLPPVDFGVRFTRRGTRGTTPGGGGSSERHMTHQDDGVGRGFTAVGGPPAPGERILTIPNIISLARLAGVPVFLWLVLGLRTRTGDWWAVGLLIAAGFSDWLDGKIARALNQQSRLGQMLDPAADRLYIGATVIALAVRSIIPWWLVGVLAARELVMALVLWVLRRHDWGPLQVSFVGKAATLCLLYAFPLLFLGSHAASYAETAKVAGWSFVFWGTALYWCSALLYIVQARRLLAAPLPGPDMARVTAAGDGRRG
jgi:cardiolipin synthase (CMP-forming)